MANPYNIQKHLLSKSALIPLFAEIRGEDIHDVENKFRNRHLPYFTNGQHDIRSAAKAFIMYVAIDSGVSDEQMLMEIQRLLDSYHADSDHLSVLDRLILTADRQDYRIAFGRPKMSDYTRPEARLVADWMEAEEVFDTPFENEFDQFPVLVSTLSVSRILRRFKAAIEGSAIPYIPAIDGAMPWNGNESSIHTLEWGLNDLMFPNYRDFFKRNWHVGFSAPIQPNNCASHPTEAFL